ncbi:hypothetical protein PoB_000545400 [Plakobranchus ocellatus]|uniref:Uncharacterized protein n=1 Tax=Plakobranchus ocellatus TaxID=259542 RepID=A0AAV3Y9L2_9GAST|nr:hypothetical protein PoB_000545400 [Plakobranchus ocellatus]
MIPHSIPDLPPPESCPAPNAAIVNNTTTTDIILIIICVCPGIIVDILIMNIQLLKSSTLVISVSFFPLPSSPNKMRSGGSSGRAVGYQVRGPGFESQYEPNQFIIAPLCPPSTKWVARSLKIR